MASIIPEVLNHFNIYNGANALVGVSGEVELPELEAITDTVEGTGVLGEIEDPVTGQFSSATIKIPFAVLYSDMFSIVNTTEPPLLTLRGSMQCTDPKTGATGYYPIRVVVRGKAKTTTLGKVAKGKKMESEVELEILYIKVEINNAVVFGARQTELRIRIKRKRHAGADQKPVLDNRRNAK